MMTRVCARGTVCAGVQNVWIVLSPRGMKNEGAQDAFDDKGEISKKRGRIARCSSQVGPGGRGTEGGARG